MKKTGKLVCILISAVITLCGCGPGTAPSNPEGSAAVSMEEPQGQPMGRYVETEITPPGAAEAETARSCALRAYAGGKIDYITWQAEFTGDCGTHHYRSPDGGATWEEVKIPWLEKILSQCGITEIDRFSPAMDFDAQGNLYCGLRDREDKLRLFRVSAAGEIAEIPMEGWKDENGKFFSVDALRITEQGGIGVRIFTDSMDAAALYRDGKPVVLVNETLPEAAVAFTDGQVAVADKKLTFHGKNGPVSELSLPHTGYELAAEVCADGTTFIGTHEGVDCLEKGASLFQTILQGSLYTFGKPKSAITMLRCLPEDESLFMALEEGGGKTSATTERLYHYTFDPQMPLKPETQLDIFSMEENGVIRAASLEFQRENPNVAVNYQVGLTEDSPMDREAVEAALEEALSTGRGPDVLLLDGLDWKAYAEKGWLAALEPDVPGTFENVRSVCRTDALYALPTRFVLYLDMEVTGLEPYRQKITGIEGLGYALDGLAEDQGHKPDPAQMKGGFIPAAMIGVTAAGERREMADAFVKAMLSEAAQAESYGDGFPILKTQFIAWLKRDYSERFAGMEDALGALCERLEPVSE